MKEQKDFRMPAWAGCVVCCSSGEASADGGSEQSRQSGLRKMNLALDRCMEKARSCMKDRCRGSRKRLALCQQELRL